MGDGGSKEIHELKSCKKVVSETGISREEGCSFQPLVFVSLFLYLSYHFLHHLCPPMSFTSEIKTEDNELCKSNL